MSCDSRLPICCSGDLCPVNSLTLKTHILTHLPTHSEARPCLLCPASSALPPSLLFLEPTARKTFFLFKGKVEKAQRGIGVFPFPFLVGHCLSLFLSVCLCVYGCVCVCVCLFALDTRRVLSGPGAARLGLPTFVLNEKETHSNERFSPRPRGSCWVAWLSVHYPGR